MNLTWHLACKDLRRFRLVLLVWALLIASKLVLGAILVLTNGGASMADFERLAVGAEFILLVERAGALLLAAIILEDPLVGDRAFWMVRPISGARLLAAKSIVLALSLVALPLLLTLPWWLLCGYDLAQIAQASGAILLFNAPALLAAGFVSVISEGLTQALARAFLALTILLGSGALVVLFLQFEPLHATRSAAVSFYWALAGGAVLIMVLHQYLTRRSVRSLWLAGGMLASFGYLVVRPPLWAWQKEDRQPATTPAASSKPPRPPFDDPAPANLMLTNRPLEIIRRLPGRTDASFALILRCEANGLERDEWLTTEKVDLRFSWPGGAEFTSTLHATEEASVKEAARSRDRLPDSNVSSQRSLTFASFHFASDQPRPPGGLPSSCSFEGRFQIRRLTRIAVPFESLLHWEGGERMVSGEKTERQRRFLIIRRVADPDFETGASPMPEAPRDAKVYRLVQPERDVWYEHRTTFRFVRIATVLVSWQEFRFLPFPAGIGPSPTPAQSISLAGAQLVELRHEDGPRFRLQGSVEVTEPLTPDFTK